MECLTKNSILLCSDSFMDVSGGAESTLAKRVANDWKFFAKLRDGKTITLTTARNVLDWFADNWPDDAQKPTCLMDHMALRQWEAANEYSCQANQPVPRIVVPPCGVSAP